MNNVQDRTGVFLLTAEKIEGFKIVEYFGLVSGQSIVGSNFIKDFFARIADRIGGNISGYEQSLERAMGNSLEQMALRAKEKGANAVIAIDVDTNTVGSNMLMASCYGTAVQIEQIKG